MDPNPTSRARELRRDATDAENHLCKRLRNRQLGFKFRRQYPIGPYFADFCCREGRLVVELDGEQHAAAEQHDLRRTTYLAERGYRLVRFSNQEALANTERLLAEISVLLEDPHRRAEKCSAASPGPGEAPTSLPSHALGV